MYRGRLRIIVPDHILDGAKYQVMQHFVGYRPKRVSWHLDKVEATKRKVTAADKFFGITIKEYYETEVKVITFDHCYKYTRKLYGAVVGEYEIECAVDEDNKKVYWKIRRA